MRSAVWSECGASARARNPCDVLSDQQLGSKTPLKSPTENQQLSGVSQNAGADLRSALTAQFCEAMPDAGGAEIELNARCGVTKWRLHDIRRTLATRLGDLGVQPHIIETILNHVGHKRGVAGVYNRSPYILEVKAALELWAGHVRSLVRRRSGGAHVS
jgi:hypothetical protein